MTIQNKHEHNNCQEWQFVSQKKNTSLKNHSRLPPSILFEKESMGEKNSQGKQNIQSICIPRVDQSISKDYIYSIFDKLDVGSIDMMTEIPLRNDATHKRILIRIRWNTKNEISCKLQDQLKTVGSIKLVYDMPWYWKIVSTHPQI